MFQWGKSSKIPAPGAAVGEVPVQKVERIEVLNLVAIKPGPARVEGGAVVNPRKPQPPAAAEGPGAGAAKTKPDSPRSDDINWRARRFIEDTKKRWYLSHKSFRGTGR